MNYLSGIGNALMVIPNSAGKLIDTVVDGRYGFGVIHSKLLEMGLDRTITLIVYGAIAGIGAVQEETCKHNAIDCPVYRKKNRNKKSVVLSTSDSVLHAIHWRVATPLIFIGGVLELRFGFTPISAEIVKRISSKLVLCIFDSYAVSQWIQPAGRSSRAKQAMAALYLTTRMVDLLANFGGVTEGLVRFNVQPLLNNIGVIKNWVS